MGKPAALCCIPGLSMSVLRSVLVLAPGMGRAVTAVLWDVCTLGALVELIFFNLLLLLSRWRRNNCSVIL